MRAWSVVVGAVVAAAAACASSGAPPAAPARELTPTDVGLADEPPPAPPRIVTAPAGSAQVPPVERRQPAYYRREECPPRRGCRLVREVTIDRMTTSVRCDNHYSSYTGAVPLRTLDARIDVGEGGLDRSIVRRAVLGAEDRARWCLGLDNVTARIELRFTIHQGRAIEIAPAPGECLGEVLARLEFPREASFTPVGWILDYRVKDPSTAPRLNCD